MSNYLWSSHTRDEIQIGGFWNATMHHENFVVDERAERQMPINLVDKFQQAIRIVSIFLMDFASEAITVVHYGVFVIATVQHHTARENDEAAQKD